MPRIIFTEDQKICFFEWLEMLDLTLRVRTNYRGFCAAEIPGATFPYLGPVLMILSKLLPSVRDPITTYWYGTHVAAIGALVALIRGNRIVLPSGRTQVVPGMLAAPSREEIDDALAAAKKGGRIAC